MPDVLDESKVHVLLNNDSRAMSREEKKHAWKATLPVRLHDVPLLRVRDCYSGSQPDATGRMDARAPRARLHTRKARRVALATHINHKDWRSTPFISFTSSPAEIESIVDWRIKRRGDQMLTVIDPAVRVAKGLPILDMGTEMAYYDADNPYGGDKYCEGQYLCLWQVTKDEIVGHWPWVELVRAGDWYRNIVMPALRAFRGHRAMRKEDGNDLLAAMNSLQGESVNAA